jgi:hypothetical protein
LDRSTISCAIRFEREQRRDRADVPELVVVEPDGARGVEVLSAEPGRLGGQLRATGARPRPETTPRALYSYPNYPHR